MENAVLAFSNDHRRRRSFHHECGTCLTAVVCSVLLAEHSRQPSPHETTWIVQSPHLPLGRAQSRVRHDDGETSGSDHAARGRELGPATHRTQHTSVFITTATRHEQVHHDAPSWACASRRCARCAGRSCARCSRQIVECRAVRPSELSGSSAIRAPTSPEFSYTSFE